MADKCMKCGKAIKGKPLVHDKLNFCSKACVEKYKKEPKICEFC